MKDGEPEAGSRALSASQGADFLAANFSEQISILKDLSCLIDEAKHPTQLLVCKHFCSLFLNSYIFLAIIIFLRWINVSQIKVKDIITGKQWLAEHSVKWLTMELQNEELKSDRLRGVTVLGIWSHLRERYLCILNPFQSEIKV